MSSCKATNANPHKWTRVPLTKHDGKRIAVWGSKTAWSGIYITEHEVIVK